MKAGGSKRKPFAFSVTKEEGGEKMKIDRDYFFCLNNEDPITQKDLESKIVKLYTVGDSTRYPGGYVYREAIRMAKLDSSKSVYLKIDGYHYGIEGAREHNRILTKEWQNFKKLAKGKKLREVLS